MQTWNPHELFSIEEFVRFKIVPKWQSSWTRVVSTTDIVEEKIFQRKIFRLDIFVWINPQISWVLTWSEWCSMLSTYWLSQVLLVRILRLRNNSVPSVAVEGSCNPTQAAAGTWAAFCKKCSFDLGHFLSKEVLATPALNFHRCSIYEIIQFCMTGLVYAFLIAVWWTAVLSRLFSTLPSTYLSYQKTSQSWSSRYKGVMSKSWAYLLLSVRVFAIFSFLLPKKMPKLLYRLNN